MSNNHEEQIRIVQETVAGKEITFAHVMGGPAPIVYQKLGLNPQVDYRSSAIGIMNMTPPESAVIASDIAVKMRKTFTLDLQIVYRNTHHHRRDFRRHVCPDRSGNLFRDSLGYVVCDITKR